LRVVRTLLTTAFLLASLMALACLPSKGDEPQPAAIKLYLPLVSRQLHAPDVVLVSPKNGGQLTTLAPELVWRATGDHWFYIEFSTDPQFSVVAMSVPARSHSGGPQYTTTLLNNLQMATLYHWRVGFDDDTGSYIWSQSGWFTTPGPGSATPSAPQPSLPTDGSAVGSLSPCLGWQGVSDARMYHITLNVHSNMFTYSVLSPGASQVIPFALLPGRTYDWHVRAFNGFAWGPESETWEFRTPGN